MSKTVAIIQTRLSSTRLPGKVLKSIMSKDLLTHVVDRLKKVEEISEIVIATTNEEQDDLLVNWCEERNLNYFRGSSENVLSRFYECAKKYGADTIIRVTSDNPLVDPNVVSMVVKKFYTEKLDYCSNNLHRTFPHGLDVEVFSFSSLETSHENAVEQADIEHVTQYIKKRPEQFKIENVQLEKDYSFIRITVDEDEDLQLIKILMMMKGEGILIEEIIKIFEEVPALLNINKSSKEKHRQYNQSEGIV